MKLFVSSILTCCTVLLTTINKVPSAAEPKTIETTSAIMKEFSLLVRVPMTYTTEQAKAVGPQWNALLAQWKKDNVYIISFAFPGESYVVYGAEGSVKKETVLSDNLRVVSNLFLRAENMEGALRLAKACPILPFGGTVEVREIPARPVN